MAAPAEAGGCLNNRLIATRLQAGPASLSSRMSLLARDLIIGTILGVNLIIAGGMGQRALSLFAENGIKVITGSPSHEPEALVQGYLAGTLVSGPNVCDH